MFQNYVDNNIKALSVVSASTAITSDIVSSGAVNRASVVKGAFDSTGFAVQFVFDTTLDNVLCSTEMSLMAFDSSKNYYPFIATYVASSPLTNIPLNGNDRVLLHSLGAATDYSVDARVIIPKLATAAGEQQYVVIGYASGGETTEYTELRIQARLHTQDYLITQPSK